MTFSSRSLNSKNDSIWNRDGNVGEYLLVYLLHECGEAGLYPDDTVESVDGGELKAQTEEVKGEDAENIHLWKNKQRKVRVVRMVSIVPI